MIKNEMKEINTQLLEVALKPLIEYNMVNDTLIINESEFKNANNNLAKVNEIICQLMNLNRS